MGVLKQKAVRVTMPHTVKLSVFMGGKSSRRGQNKEAQRQVIREALEAVGNEWRLNVVTAALLSEAVVTAASVGAELWSPVLHPW